MILLPARTVVRVDMSSTVLDAFLVLFDSNGKLVAQDDDAGSMQTDACSSRSNFLHSPCPMDG